ALEPRWFDFETTGRQGQTALEAPLRQLEPVDHRALQFGAQATLASNDEYAIVDRHLDLAGIDAGQRGQHAQIGCGFEDVDRRLPSGCPARAAGSRLEHLALQSIGSRYGVDGV